MAKQTKPVELAPVTNENVNDANVNDASNQVATETPTATETEKPQPASAKLTELRTSYDAMEEKMVSLPKGSDERKASVMELYKIDKLIDAELINIKRIENEAAKKEAEAGIVKLFDDAIDAFQFHLNKNGSDASIDEKNVAYDAYKAAREIVVNKLLGSTPRPTVTASGSTVVNNGSRGAIGAKIRELYIANKAAGMSNTEAEKNIVSQGFSRGTTGAVAHAYRIEIGESK